MFNILNKKSKQAGFTLIELITTSLVFSIVLMSVSLIYTQSLGVQRRASAAQKIQENALYVFELIAKEIRVSTVTSSDSSCILPGSFGTVLNITHPVNGAVSYSLNVGTGLMTRTEGGIVTNISARDVKFNNFNFCIKGSGNDGQQARIMMFAEIENVSTVAQTQLKFKLQTTVATRELTSE